MAITSESQLIDIEAVRNGCVKYVEALDYFVKAGQQVVSAGDTCNKDAMSVDNSSMQPVLYEIGQGIAQQANVYSEAASNVYAEAVNIYNKQVAELNAYYQRLAEEQAKKNNS